MNINKNTKFIVLIFFISKMLINNKNNITINIYKIIIMIIKYLSDIHLEFIQPGMIRKFIKNINDMINSVEGKRARTTSSFKLGPVPGLGGGRRRPSRQTKGKGKGKKTKRKQK